MDNRPDRRFYEDCARVERKMARIARGPTLTSIHGQLADMYQGLADGLYWEEEVSADSVVASRPITAGAGAPTLH